MAKNEHQPLPTSAPTPWDRSTRDGIFIKDPSAWVYRVVPNEIIMGADESKREEGAQPLMSALDMLATKSRDRNRRSLSKSSYRPFHILSLSVPARFNIPPGRHDLSSFTNRGITRRVTFLGTPLMPKISARGPKEMVRKTVDEFVRVLLDPGEFNMDSVMTDYESVTGMLNGSRLQTPSQADRSLISAWWNWGRWSDTPYIPYHDHIRIFYDAAAARTILSSEEMLKDPDLWLDLPGQHSLSFASVYEWQNDAYDSLSGDALWGSSLFNWGAIAVSIRGLLEPARVTRNELAIKKKRIVGDIEDRASQGKLSRVEEQDALEELSYAEQIVAGRDALPTLTDTVVTVAFSGTNLDWDEISAGTGLGLKPLDSRQRLALTEVQPCAPVIANPHRHDMSMKVISHAGLNSLSRIGDDDGALLGFTPDNQPAWVSPVAASATDSRPTMVILGATRSGKTIATEWLAYQWVQLGRPTIFINPKQEDDLSPFADACGGNVVWLDRLMDVDGVLDPFRYAEGENSASLALAFIAASNPFGTRAMLSEVEPRLSAALRFGGDSGATCTGEALDIAVAHGKLEPAVRDRIFEVADSQPFFRLGCGRNPTSQPLRASGGLTLIQMGSANLDLPAPGARPENLSQRVSVAALRLLVFGAAYALRKRKGVLIFDEAWTFFSGDAASEMDRLGRLAASQDFLPVALTQKVTDITSAGMHNYVSRVIALAMPADEAEAACTMLGIDPTPDRIGAFTADPEFGYSLKALIDKKTREVKRPARCFYRDLDGNVSQVYIEIPPAMIEDFSTNPEDRRRRAERKALEQGGAAG